MDRDYSGSPRPCSSAVEHTLGKGEVTSSILVTGFLISQWVQRLAALASCCPGESLEVSAKARTQDGIKRRALAPAWGQIAGGEFRARPGKLGPKK
jgi:hypothetical protein